MATPRRRPTRSALSYLDDELAVRFQDAVQDPRALEAFWAEVMAAGQWSAEAIDGALQELRDLLQRVDPLRTLGALTMFDAFRRDSFPGEANFGSDAMLELLATVICSEEEAAALARIDHEFEFQRIWPIEQVLRRIANHISAAETARVMTDRTDGESSPLLNMLRLENAFDRMAGFDPHVRRVVTTVFSKVDEHARQHLGFALSDSLAFGSLYGQVRMVHADRANDFVANFERPESFVGEEGKLRWAMAHMTLYALHSAPPLEGGPLDDELASKLELSQDEFSDLVDAMSTNLGSVDPARVLEDTSVRTRPLLRLSSGEWMWVRPIDFVHGAMGWALEVCKKDQNLLQKFDAARQSTAEDLTADVLEEVFGREHVFRNVTYPDTESDAESDTIVALPGVVLLVETKGGRFSAPGRRAAPLRVEKHAKELVEAAADQNQRTAKAIANNKALTDKSGRTVPTHPTDAAVPIIVTLDRVDPFSTFLGQPRHGAQEERNWVLNLADLVMLTDVLSSPEEFVAYAMKRLQMVRDHVRVFVEADCLGHWCEDRTARVKEMSDSLGHSIRLVSETAEGMNDYFTQATIDAIDPEAGRQRRRVAKPGVGIPTQVLDALRAERASGSRQWPALVDQVAQVAPKAWRPLERLLVALSRRGARAPSRQLAKSIRRAQGGWTLDGRVVVKLISPETEVLRLSLPNDRDGTTG